jgi:SHS2 domain-containing protein
MTDPTPSPSRGYRVLSHTADTGIEAHAESLGSLITVLSLGMFELMAPCQPSKDLRWVTFEVDAPTVEDLVVDALSELLYHSEAEDIVFCEVRVDVDSDALVAKVEAGGVPVHAVEAIGPPVKAITYHDLIVEPTGQGWRGRVYFDV